MKSSCPSNTIVTIHLDDVDKIDKPLGTIMEELVTAHNVPLDKQVRLLWLFCSIHYPKLFLQVLLFTHLRLAHCFGSLEGRLKCVQVRLQALSVLIYSNALMENAHQLLYSNLLEEMVEVLEMQDIALVEIKAAALRTLTAIIHLDRNPHMSKYVVYAWDFLCRLFKLSRSQLFKKLQTQHNYRCNRGIVLPWIPALTRTFLHLSLDGCAPEWKSKAASKQRCARASYIPLAFSHSFVQLLVPSGQLWARWRGSRLLQHDGEPAESDQVAW